jgi:hypothetical protein
MSWQPANDPKPGDRFSCDAIETIIVPRSRDLGSFEIANEHSVAMFGSFTYKTRTLGKEITSPFALLAKVTGDKISYIQFLEDTFGTASTFRAGGTWHFRGVATGGEVSVG